MLCNHSKTRHSLFLTVTLMAAMLVACGGDEPAPPPPPPPPPPFVPQNIAIELGTSGESLTLQTTQGGGFTRDGNPFASGTTVDADGSTYRLVLEGGNWTATYVAPRPWAAALGTSGDALLIVRREDGLYEAGDHVFGSGSTVIASNGNQYQLTFVPDDDRGTWQVAYVPPEPTPVLLGISGDTVLVQRLEGGGYTVGDQRVVDGSTVQSAAGSSYRLNMQHGEWTATFLPPPPVVVMLGASGQTLALQVSEDGKFEKDGELYPSGSLETVGGRTYRLVLQNGAWSATFLPPPPVTVTLGMSEQTITLGIREDGQFEKDGELYPSGSLETVGGRTYRLVLQNGAWSAMFEPPPPIEVPLGTSGETVILQVTEAGTFTKDGQPYIDGTIERTQAGNQYRLTLTDGMWTATFQAPTTVQVALGASGDTITLVAQENGTFTLDGVLFVPDSIVERDGVNYRISFQNGEWSAQFVRSAIPVEGPGGIILFLEENGTVTYNGETVGDGSIITVGGTTYELLELTDGWLAVPGAAPPPTPGDQSVSLPGSGQTITLTRTDTGNYTYLDAPVFDGQVITVSGFDYRLRQGADGLWFASAVTGGGVNPETVGGPTQRDEVDPFTEERFASDTTTPYGVRFRRPGRTALGNSGTTMVPAQFDGDSSTSQADLPEFPVYGLVGRGLVSQERTYVEAARAKLQEIISVIELNRPLYAADNVDPHDHIGSDGDMGLWDDAENAVAKIFGLLSTDNPLGRNPAGSRVDTDEVDHVIDALQEAVSSLSNLERFTQEFGDIIADKNAVDDTDFDAEDFFTGVVSMIRFGSTNSTRFGAYAVRGSFDPEASEGRQHAAQSGSDIRWDTGVIAYTPVDAPRAADIPTRGQATYQGDTTAIDSKNVNSPILYAGKIELIARFARAEVTGTVTELKDASGNEWEYWSDFSQRSEVVSSIELPKAIQGGDQIEPGFYKTESSPLATLAFDRNLPNTTKTDGVGFRVQLLNDAREALGGWEAFNLKGSFGATRSGTVATPTLPSYNDRGDGVKTETRVVYIGSTSSPNAISTTTEDNTFTLTRSNLGDPPGDLGDGDASDELVYDLTYLYGRTSTSTLRDQTFVANARTMLSRWSSELRRSSVDPSNIRSSFQENADAALNAIGIGFVPAWANDWDGDSTPGEEADYLRAINDVHAALGSRSRFKSEQEPDGVLTGVPTYTDEQIDTLLRVRTLDFAIRTDRTRYTRFGAWSQMAPDKAADIVDSDADVSTIAHGMLAYSFLDKEAGVGLTFTADYRGTTVAVDEDTGDLYRGTIDLIVNWNDGDDGGLLRSSVTDLRGVSGTSSYLQHDSKDVRTIFFSGITVSVDGAFTSSSATVDIAYRDGLQKAGVSRAGRFEGVFVGDKHGDGPLGVLGRWRIGGDIDFQGSFGADLQP